MKIIFETEDEAEAKMMFASADLRSIIYEIKNYLRTIQKHGTDEMDRFVVADKITSIIHDILPNINEL